MKKDVWRNDEEYMSYVGELLEKPEVQRLADYTQHHFSTNDIFFAWSQYGQLFCITHSNSWMDPRMRATIKFSHTPIIVKQIMQQARTSRGFCI